MKSRLDLSRKAALTQEAHRILKQNDRGGYTVPNNAVYPFQWNWDSAFVALGFSTFDRDRAWRELETLFLGQWADGMVPSIVFHSAAEHYYPGPAAWGTSHQPPTTGISQPPVAASVARLIIEAEPRDTATEERAHRLFDQLYASHRWWHTIRDPEGTGLVTIIHPWETGRDNSPDWDEPLAAITPSVNVASLRKDNKIVDPSERPTDLFYNRVMTLVEEAKALNWDGLSVARSLSLRVCDLGIQCILLRADHDLLALAERLNRKEEARQLALWIERSKAASEQLKAPDGSYRSLDLITGMLAPCMTSASFLPLYAHIASEDDAAFMAKTLKQWQTVTPFLVASSDPFHSSYDAKRYWRGPLWIVVNRMIADGFIYYGYDNLAEDIRAASEECIAQYGFREYFDTRTGEGVGGRDFSWTAALWLEWIMPAEF
jgi:glycogen debranching enzyme